MGLSNIYYSDWLGGLVVNGSSANTTITSTTIKDLAEQLPWYPVHWQKEQLDQLLSSSDPFAGNDLIFGGQGDDFIESSSGNDRIFAGGGDDTIDGGTGTDWVFAGSGNDTGIFSDTNTDGYDLYSGGSGYDTLVLNLSLEDYQNSKSDIEDFISNLNTFWSYIPFTFQDLGLVAYGWEELKVIVDPIIQSSDAKTISETENVTGSSETVSTTGSLQFADDAFSEHTVSANLHSATWSGGDLSAAVIEQLSLGFAADLGNVVDGEGAINWSFSIEDARLDFLAADQHLEVVFQVSIDDGQATDSGFVTVTISGANDAPTAQNITAVMDEDSGSVVLTPQFTDPDLDDVHVVSFEDFGVSPSAGLSDITDNGDGTFTYVASDSYDSLALGDSATETLSYTVIDSSGATSTASVTITIEGRNDDPTLQAGALAAAERGDAVDLDLSTLGSDIDGDDDGSSLTYTVSGAPDKGQVIIDGTVLSFDPAGDFAYLNAGETEDITIEVTATDSHGATAVNTVTVTVSGTGGDPLFSPEDFSTGRIEFEFQAFDLETGQVALPDFPGGPDGPDADFKFAYNGNYPSDEVNAVLFQNQYGGTPVEIAFLDEIALGSLTQADVDGAVFTSDLIDMPFESDDTILLKTRDGNVFAIGNTMEHDAPGEDNSVSFEYAQVGGTTGGDPLFSPEDLSTGRIEYEFQGFDLETGEVKIPDFPGMPEIPGSDFTFAYNGNTPPEGINAVLFQNQTPDNPVEIAFLDEIALGSLTQADVDGAFFTSQLVDLPFEADDTILLRTADGNVFAIGNTMEHDAPGEDFTVSFDYAQVGGTTGGDPLFSPEDLSTGRIEFEFQAFDLETGQVALPDFPGGPDSPDADFKFAYNGNYPSDGVNAVLFQYQYGDTPVEIAFLDEIALGSLTQADVDGAVFTSDLIDMPFESDDTILLKTGDGNVFAIGNTMEHDAPGEDNSVSFDYALVEGITPPPDGVLSAEDLSTGEVEFMFEGFDLETGTAQFGTFPVDFDFLDADFMFDYDQTTPSDGTNAIFVQNGSPLNEAQIAFFDESSLLNLTQAQIDSAVFSSEQLQQPFESDDTVLIKTWDGNVYALGNAVERDQPGGDYKVSFDYALIESDPSDPLFSPEDFSNGRIQFESQGFDLETGEVKDAQFPGDLNIPGSDFNFAYNGNPPRENTNAVLFQNQSPDNPVEIAFLDGIDLDELTQRDVDNAFFTTSLVSDLFEADDTVLLRTGDGNVFAIGNAVEYDLPGEDFTVSFDYAQINAPVSSDPVIAPEDLSSGRIGYEFEAFDLETGTKQHGTFPSDFDFSDNDFIFAYDSRPGAEGTNAAMLQSTSPLNQVEIAFIDEVDLDDLSQADLDAAVFTFDAIAEPFESDDTILVKTKEGNIFAVGNSVEHDLPGEDFSVSFDYANLTDLF
ncbi:Ig-like domain-containing protein [Roseibium sp.]|uniref:Ig-like domain-containing protein n=1 Tax=Roseibium sp. TaxID=1936156 RepID=UPI003BAEA474